MSKFVLFCKGVSFLQLIPADNFVPSSVAKGRLFAFYAPELVEKIIRTGRMDVSAEINAKEGYKDKEIEVYTSWAGLGVTVLGDGVKPAIPGASIKALAALQSEFNETKLKAASLTNQENKPQQESEKKELKPGMGLTKKQLSDMRAKLPDPSGILALYAVTRDKRCKEESLRTAIPEFRRFNIVENEVRNVL